MLLQQLIDGFLLDCKSRKLSPHTLKTYKPVLRELCDFLQNSQSHNITTNDLRHFIIHVQNRNRYAAGNHPFKEEEEDSELSVWTVHKYVRNIKTLFAWAVREGVLSEDPANNLKKPKLPQGRVDRFTEDEINMLLEQAKTTSYRNYCITFLLLDSGLRKGELARLETDDVNVLTGVVTVRHGKGNKQREIRVGNACRKVLWRYVNDFRKPIDEEETTFFLTRGGKPLSYHAIGMIFTRLSKQCGFRIYPHKFRHTFATNLAKQVPNAFLVAQALGHSDLNTAMIYVHLAQSEVSNTSPMDAHLKKQ